MPTLYDLFASYAHDDDEHGHITAFIEQLKAVHRSEFKDSDINIFFDQREIRTSHDWENRITTGLRRSRLFLAFTSPAYYASEYCRREWQEWIDQEIATQILSEGAFPIYTLALPSLNPGTTPEQHSRYLAELADVIRQRADTLTQSSPARAASLRARAEAIIGRGQPIIRQAVQLNRRQSLGRHDPAGEILPFFPDGADELRRGSLADILRQLATGLRDKEALVQTAGHRRSYIPDYNRHFSGRTEELLTLRKHLTDDKNGTFAGIHGLGGIGKTELAFAYAHAYGHYYPGGRYLLPCENAQDLRLVLTRLEGNPLPVIEGDARKDLDLYYRLLIQSLRDYVRKEGRTLLVLDNVNSHALLGSDQTDHLANFDGQLHLLATTREEPPRAQATSGRIHWLPLDRLDEDSAGDLLRKHRDFEKEDHAQPGATQPASGAADEYQPRPEGLAQTAAGEIVSLLGGFTLATELVGSFLAVHPAVSYPEMADRLRADSLDQLDQAAEDRDTELRRHNNEKRLQSILDWTLQKLTEIERDILDYAALLAPDYILLPWLHHLAAPRHPQLGGRAGSLRNQSWQQAIARLTSLSLLSRASKDDTDLRILRTHRLLQQYLVRQLQIEQETGQRLPGSSFADREKSLHDHSLVRAKFLWDGWVEHENRWEILPLAAQAEHWMHHPSGIGRRLASPLMGPLRELMHMGEAESLLVAALNTLVPTQPATTQDTHAIINRLPELPENGETATLLSNLAALVVATNRLAEAEPLMQRALAVDEVCFGPNHPEVGKMLNNLAVLLQTTNRITEAEPLMRRALAIDEACFGPNDSKVIIRLSNLAVLLRHTNRLAEAEPLMRRALAMDEACHGATHPNVAIRLNNLAGLLQTTNRPVEAEPLMRRALAIDEACFGPNHPEVATELNNLAQLLQVTGRLGEAEPLMRRALAINEDCLGPDHPAVAIILNTLAELLRVTKRPVEAEPMYQRALAIAEASYGVTHPEVATMLSGLALLLKTTDRLPEAEPLMRRALAIAEVSYGATHPEVAKMLNNLAVLLQATNRITEAEPLMRRALAIDEASYGNDHPEVATRLNNLGSLLRATNRLAEAEPLLQRMLSIFLHFTADTGHPHPHLKFALQNYTGLCQAMQLPDADMWSRLTRLFGEAGIPPEDGVALLSSVLKEM